MTGHLTGLIAAALLAAAPGGPGRAGPGPNPIVSKAKEREELVVVTNGLYTALELTFCAGIRTIVVGGTIRMLNGLR